MNPESGGLLRSDATGEAKKVPKSFIRAISSIHKIRKRDLDHGYLVIGNQKESWLRR